MHSFYDSDRDWLNLESCEDEDPQAKRVYINTAKNGVYLNPLQALELAKLLLVGNPEPEVATLLPKTKGIPREVSSFLLSNRYGNASEGEAYSALATFFEEHYGYIYP